MRRTRDTPRGRRLVLLAAALLALTSVGGVLAARSQSTGAINACVLAPTGEGRPLAAPNVMIVTGGRECPSGWNPLTWNVRGPAGPRGPQGQQGPAGPSAAYGRFRDGPIEAPRARDSKLRPAKSVLQLQVPSGSYVIAAKVVATTKSRKPDADRWAFIVRCMLEAGGDFDLAQAGDTTEEIFTRLDSMTLALSVVHRFEGTAPHVIDLKCTDAPGLRYAELRDMKITAIQVGSLTNSAQHGGVNP